MEQDGVINGAYSDDEDNDNAFDAPEFLDSKLKEKHGDDDTGGGGKRQGAGGDEEKGCDDTNVDRYKDGKTNEQKGADEKSVD